MKYAVDFEDREYTVETFRQRYGTDHEVEPHCPSCKEAVVDVFSLKDPRRRFFRHQPHPESADWIDDCALANREDRWGSLFTNSGPWREDRGRVLRTAFIAEANRAPVRRFFDHVMKLSRKGPLPSAEINVLIRKGDRKGVWGLDGLSLWMAPYLLLTLGKFENSRVKFHFYFGELKEGEPREMKRRATYKDSGRKADSRGAEFMISEEYHRQHSGPADNSWAGHRNSTCASGGPNGPSSV